MPEVVVVEEEVESFSKYTAPPLFSAKLFSTCTPLMELLIK